MRCGKSQDTGADAASGTPGDYGDTASAGAWGNPSSGAFGEQATARYEPPPDPQDWADDIATARDLLSESSALEVLWERAVAGVEDEQQQQRRYWMLINEDQSATAAAARELLVRAGYELGRSSEPGRMRDDLPEPDGRPDPTEAANPDLEFQPGCVCGVYLTIVGGLCLTCARLAAAGFEPNADRTAGRAAEDATERFETQRLATEVEDNRLRAREASNLCMNLDGPSVVGRLCSNCAAQLRNEERQLERYQRAFTEPLAATEELASLWRRATQSAGPTPTYDSARDEFWRLASTAPESEARFVRGMLQAAGFDMSPGHSPVLRLDTEDRREGRNRADRLLTLEHMSPQSADKARVEAGLAPLALDPGNLRYMLGWDNSVRGDGWTVTDEPVSGWPAFWQRQSRRRRRRGKR
ncbi:hypothetical protein [Nocardioides marmoraquaticus]